MTRYGICLSPFMDIRPSELVRLAREAEDAGFAGAFIPEGNNDGLMCCYAIACATTRIQIATWIANIYFREPILCAAGAAMVQEESNGRFVLGLGVSHRPAMQDLGIEMGKPRERLRGYTLDLRRLLRGEAAGSSGRRVRTSPLTVPIYFAALALETVRLGGELADGLMLDICTPERLRTAIASAHDTARQCGRTPADVILTAGIPVFLSDAREEAFEAARRTLGRYATLPAYNRLFERSGFDTETAAVRDAVSQGDSNAMVAAISDRMIDALALAGSNARCIERLEQFHGSGADTLILRPFPVREDYASCVRRAIRVFGKSA